VIGLLVRLVSLLGAGVHRYGAYSALKSMKGRYHDHLRALLVAHPHTLGIQSAMDGELQNAFVRLACRSCTGTVDPATLACC